MGNIYVDELPKNCYECPCYIGINCRCKLKHEYLDNDGYEVPINCPLKPLSDRLAEERKKVCDAVYKLTRELLSFGFKTVSIEDVENVIKQFDEEE